MKKNKRYNHKINYYTIFSLVIIFIIITLSIGFSAFQNTLAIENISSNVRIDKDIRIMKVSVDTTNDATSLYEDYNVSNVTSKVVLPSSDSYIIYEIDIYNLGNVEMGIKNISINNSKLNVTTLDYNIKDKLCTDNECSLGVEKKIKLKVSYKEGEYDSNNTTMDFKVDFKFGQFFKINYKNISNSNDLPSEIIEGDDLKISFSNDKNQYLRVLMNNKVLYSDKDYTYDGSNLVISNVSGDIDISLNDNTAMKKQLISNFVPSGDEADVTDFDIDNMTDDERKKLFSDVASESGIYKTKGIDGANVIIFRGNVENNYVQFAGYLWRILQIDANGNLRLIMNGIIGSSKYNADDTINSVEEASNILGFENSIAKTNLDSWYQYLEKSSSRIVKTKFCNNFDYISKVSSGSKNTTNYFKSYQNVGTDIGNYTPSLVCPSKYIFESNIGLISGEEFVLAGGSFEKSNTSFFLYNSTINNSYWTLSPAFHDEGRKNGDVMIIDNKGALKDWSFNLVKENYNLRPVITIDGDYEMLGTGTKEDPYHYDGINQTGNRISVTDVSELNGNTYFIGNIGGKKNVNGLMSSIVSQALNNVNGLLGKGTAIFSNDKDTIKNDTGIPFIFENATLAGDDASDGYYYYLKTACGEYLKINDDKSIGLTKEPVQLKIKLGTLESRSGQVLISNKDETVYLNFYGAASNEGDDKFAGWTEVDDNAYMTLYKLN